MWETDLVQARSDRAWLPRSDISSQMGIGTREFCHVPFVVSNKCFSAADVVKAFPPLSPSLLVEPWHPSAPSRYSLAWEPVTRVIGWQGFFFRTGVGSFPAFSSNPAASSVFISDSTMKETHRYRRTVGVVEERAWCIVKAASSSQSFLYSHRLPKSFRQHALSLFIKEELGQRGGERASEWDRETECKWEKFGGWTAMKYSPPTVIAAVKADT